MFVGSFSGFQIRQEIADFGIAPGQAIDLCGDGRQQAFGMTQAAPLPCEGEPIRRFLVGQIGFRFSNGFSTDAAKDKFMPKRFIVGQAIFF